MTPRQRIPGVLVLLIAASALAGCDVASKRYVQDRYPTLTVFATRRNLRSIITRSYARRGPKNLVHRFANIA
jgi:hypothetical protein